MIAWLQYFNQFWFHLRPLSWWTFFFKQLIGLSKNKKDLWWETDVWRIGGYQAACLQSGSSGSQSQFSEYQPPVLKLMTGGWKWKWDYGRNGNLLENQYEKSLRILNKIATSKQEHTTALISEHILLQSNVTDFEEVDHPRKREFARTPKSGDYSENKRSTAPLQRDAEATLTGRK